MGVTQQKTEQFALNIANCVHYHGELLNALVTCVNKIEARAVQLQAQQRQQRVQLSDRLHSRRASTKLYDQKTAQADEKVEKGASIIHGGADVEARHRDTLAAKSEVTR